MKKEVIDQVLMECEPEDLYPIWVISYNRANNWPTYKRIREHMDPDVMQEKLNVVVRESQVRDYKRSSPGVNVWGIPDGYRGWEHSCGMARQAAMDFAYQLEGHNRVIMLDDDILHFRYLFQSAIQSGPNKGAEKSGHDLSSDRHERDPLLIQHILTLFSKVADSAFEHDPTIVSGSARKQNMSHAADNHKIKFMVNRGMTPRQFMARDLERINEAGITLDVPAFGIHGEDIGFTAQLLEAGLSCFNTPSLAYDVWSEDSNIKLSSIRNAENAAELHQMEYDALRNYEIFGNYLKVTKASVIDGSYEWGDIDWRAFHKLRGTKAELVYWDEQEELLGSLI